MKSQTRYIFWDKRKMFDKQLFDKQFHDKLNKFRSITALKLQQKS